MPYFGRFGGFIAIETKNREYICRGQKKKNAKICDTLCIVLLNFANMWKYCLRNIAKGSSIICPLIQCMSSVIAHLVI